VIVDELYTAFEFGNGSFARKQRALLNAEHGLTPLEFQSVTQQLCKRFPNARAELRDLHLSQLLEKESPTPYMSKQLFSGATLFHDPETSCTNKSLVLAFCGQAQRLMIPTGLFLQLLPHKDVDLLILQDSDRTHFAHGLRGYATNFSELITRLDADVKLGSYKSACCYGTSMGGFVALRCSLLLATKGISVGGKFPWHIHRLLTGQPLPAFDFLCACKAAAAAKFICVYGNHMDDLRAVDHLATMFPVTRLQIEGVTDHNVIFAMWKRGTLRQFYREQFVLSEVVEKD
jgi:hypothetical protein